MRIDFYKMYQELERRLLFPANIFSEEIMRNTIKYVFIVKQSQKKPEFLETVRYNYTMNL